MKTIVPALLALVAFVACISESAQPITLEPIEDSLPLRTDGSPPQPDGSPPDSAEREDTGPIVCTPISDASACSQHGVTCGPLELADDGCGASRTAYCGTCPATERCSAAGQCLCAPEADSVLCAEAGRVCGPLDGVTDRCGTTRDVASCGVCSEGTCDANGQCLICTPESDAAFCLRFGRACGPLTMNDNCGEPRTVSCGACSAPSSCDSTGQCVCTPESDLALCQRAQRACGSLAINDTCGHPRTVSCGTCPAPNSCNSAGQCVCIPETDAQLCAQHGGTCNPLSVHDRCGTWRVIPACAACPGGTVCNGAGSCVQCVSNVQCASNSYRRTCDSTSSTCVECLSDNNCSWRNNNKACLLSARTCVACTNNSHCAGNPNWKICKTTTHECVRCTKNSDCNGSAVCRNNRCEAR